MKNQKGITLVALIITVIVMLILAGVSIAMTLNQGGIFEKSQTAVNEYSKKVEDMDAQLKNLETDFNRYYGEAQNAQQ